MKFVTSDFIYDNLIAKAIFLNDFIYKLSPINVDAFYLFSHMLTWYILFRLVEKMTEVLRFDTMSRSTKKDIYMFKDFKKLQVQVDLVICER